jgi:hypothetical protein
MNYLGTNGGGSALNYNGTGCTLLNTLGSLGSLGASLYGSQNAAEAQTQGINAGIGTQTGSLANINSIYGTQAATGNAAMGTLGSTLGVNGQPANYNNFLNMPGYQFAVGQGTQAIQRQASATGMGYTPNTQAAVGQYVTGTAMQDYNTYINQLLSTSQLGASANQGMAQAQQQIGSNISSLQVGSGTAQAGGYSSAGGALSSALNPYMLGNIGSGVNSLINGTNSGSGVSNTGCSNTVGYGGAYNYVSPYSGTGCSPYVLNPNASGYSSVTPTNVGYMAGVPNWLGCNGTGCF